MKSTSIETKLKKKSVLYIFFLNESRYNHYNHDCARLEEEKNTNKIPMYLIYIKKPINE